MPSACHAQFFKLTVPTDNRSYLWGDFDDGIGASCKHGRQVVVAHELFDLSHNARLRARRLALLREPEPVAADRAAPGDALDGWLPAPLTEALIGAGMQTLADLQRGIARGGHWWQRLPAFRPVKV